MNQKSILKLLCIFISCDIFFYGLVLRYRFSLHKYFRLKLLQVPTPKGENKSLIKLHSTKLIISTGDLSDIDGFLALAEYSKVCISHFNRGLI